MMALKIHEYDSDLLTNLCKIARLDPNRMYRKLSVKLEVNHLPEIQAEFVDVDSIDGKSESLSGGYMLLCPQAWAALQKAMLYSGEQPIPSLSLSREINEFRRVLYETQGIGFEQYT